MAINLRALFSSLTPTISGTARSEFLRGTAGVDVISALAGNDTVFAGRGDDIILPGSGINFVDGGEGSDTVVLSGASTDYRLTKVGSGNAALTFVAKRDANGRWVTLDTLVRVEAVHFQGDGVTRFLDGRNSPITANGDVLTTDEDTPATISAASLIANDIDGDRDVLTVSAVSGTSALGAAVSLAGGIVTYNPAGVLDRLKAGETVTDTFTYTVSDGRGETAEATVTVTLTGVNDRPVLNEQGPVSVAENATSAVVAIAATDVDGTALTYAIAGGADAALFTIDPVSGELRFINPPDFEAPADAGRNNVYDLDIKVTDSEGATDTLSLAVTVTDVAEVPPVEARINELHYDNTGTDAGEFVEIRVKSGDDVSQLRIELYNGNGGAVYGSSAVSPLTKTTDGTYDYYVWNLPANGIQNGSPDGIALSNGGTLIEFLSYEGTFAGVGGAANGVTSVDIGVSEAGADPAGLSLQRAADGTWEAPSAQNPGASNDPVPVARINEFHYDNAGTDAGEFIEVRTTKGFDVTNLSVALYNGTGGVTYGAAFPVNLATKTTDADYDYYVVNLPANGIQNGAPDGLALVDGTTVIEFLSYEGSFAATNGPANGSTSTDIGVAEAGTEAVGLSLQRKDDDTWQLPFAETKGTANSAAPPPPPVTTLISAIQGAGTASALVGQVVTTQAIVTKVLANGFFMQEEAADQDANAETSEGIFVFTSTAPAVTVGAIVRAAGTVTEFNGLTELTNTTVTTVSSGNALPTAQAVTIPLASATALEQYEGMLVSVSSGTASPLTIIENFDFDRFGELTLSAGNQVQPTQIYDAQTQQAEIDALQLANSLNRITIDDGITAQNPSRFAYIAVTGSNDNGNGILDAGDTFNATGPTVRLGAQLTAPVDGVLTYQFGSYAVLPTGTLAIDETTNAGARPQTAPEAGGTIQVASFNVLNYFTTLNVPGATTGPSNLAPRGATTAADLERQTDQLVNAMLSSGVEVFGLQEMENNGFTSTSAVFKLVGALNLEAAARGLNVNYQFVDPTTDQGFIGTDAITNAIIYDANAVTLVESDFFAFIEASSTTTSTNTGIADLQRSRPVVAATFTENATGEKFNVAVNHLKSKGASGLDAFAATPGLDANIDQGDGQAYWNAVRLDAANELVTWLEQYEALAGETDTVVIGDFNSYAKEDPVQAMIGGGYTDLIERFIGQSNAYSFVFDGQRGTLDQGFASDTMNAQIAGAQEWHINADEPDLLGYSSQFKDPRFFSDDVFATADHDPLIIGLNLGVPDTLLV